MRKSTRFFIAYSAACLAVAVAIASGPSVETFEDGSVSVDFCIPFSGCSGWVYPYGGPDSLNEGWVIGNCGYETRGDPGFFCLDPNQ